MRMRQVQLISGLALAALCLVACGNSDTPVARDSAQPQQAESAQNGDVMSLDCADKTQYNQGVLDHFTQTSPHDSAAEAARGMLREGESLEVESLNEKTARVALLRPDGTTRVVAGASTSGDGWLIDTLSSCAGESLAMR